MYLEYTLLYLSFTCVPYRKSCSSNASSGFSYFDNKIALSIILLTTISFISVVFPVPGGPFTENIFPFTPNKSDEPFL